MKATPRLLLCAGTALFATALLWFGPLTSRDSRALGAELLRLDRQLRPDGGAPGPAWTASLHLLEVEGLPPELAGRRIEAALRLPDRLRLETEIDGNRYRIGRDGGSIWFHAPERGLAVLGERDAPRFTGHPGSVDPVELPQWDVPVPRWQLALLPAAVRVERDEGRSARLRCRPRPWLARLAGLPAGLEILWTPPGSGSGSGEAPGSAELELRLDRSRVRLAVEDAARIAPEDAEALPWGLVTAPGEEVDRVALSHLVRFAAVTLAHLDARIPSLPPPDGTRALVAEHGGGRLESIEGTRVLFLRGTPEEMGRQHGALLGAEARNLVDRIVYGVGVGSSFGKGRWFFGEIEEAQRRVEPFTDERCLREMDALAEAAGLHPQEVRLANFFPELFHCSGFALHGSATADGRIYHGRILDYLRGLGLEQNAVVVVVEPDIGNAWVNVGYAGFVGTVTAMNEKQVAIGEMGGGGEGDWDGRPMAQLMREVMERADTIDEAVEIMRSAPRTCEYYYVVSDAKCRRAVGIKATPEIFETVWSGESHPELPRPVPDTVLLSSGSRYDALVDRVEEGFGSFDEESARALMERPVAMTSNIQSVLFAPDTLDFWVANADSENVASHTRYTRYNLAELLGRPAPGVEGVLTSADPEQSSGR